MMQEENTHSSVRLWDLPVRLFHWVLVALIALSWWSGEEGGNAMEWHFYSGYTILTLVLFRILWGIAGSETARFASFLSGWQAAHAYLAELFGPKAKPSFGHNAVGGWMVMLMVLATLIQAVSGLFIANDEGAEGPLNHFISGAAGDILMEVHETTFDVLLALVAIHVTAVFFYRFVKKDDLVRPMLTGYKKVVSGVTMPALKFQPLWLALIMLAIASGVVYYVVAVLGAGQ
jgi:cytochrome b